MREIFVGDLVKDILGPRNGPFEQLSEQENPLNEYLTGVLIPVKQYIEPQDEKEEEQEMQIPGMDSDEMEDTYDGEISKIPVGSPSLNPKRRPSSMGITFFVKRSSEPIRACITWAEYETIMKEGGEIYQRTPRSRVINIPWNDNNKIKISENKEIYLSYRISNLESSEEQRISLFVVNDIDPGNRWRVDVKDVIFQPQIRIKLGNGAKLLVYENVNADNSTDSELSLLYRHRNFSVRGHLCSVILKEFDPQIFSEDFHESRSRDAIESPAFKWIDGISSANLTEEEVREFSEPDLRTEFVPMYSVPSPEYDLEENTLDLNAEKLSQAWDPKDLEHWLSPMLDKFEQWIESNKQELSIRPEHERNILSRLAEEATISLRRMKKGLNLLLTDEKARLAFCLTNRAMELQYSWSKKGNLKWRPFQIAYFLLTVESIYNQNSDDRDVCDLLWVPTGGGKTEAYLAIMAFTIILRRLKNLENFNEGFGTSVITRYTLRLLAIQQFRRTLALITALEYLRVVQVGKDQYGWRPEGYSAPTNFLLGTSSFTAGLWVGSGITPNKLEGTYFHGEGAINKLETLSISTDSSEPAQITNCPSCKAILSIPADGLKKGKHALHIVVRADYARLQRSVSSIKVDDNRIKLDNLEIRENDNKQYSTLMIEFEAMDKLSLKETDSFLNNAIGLLRKYDDTLRIASSHITRPGYFLRTYVNRKGKTHKYNFDIFCPNPNCPLRIEWFAGTPAGMIHNRKIEDFPTVDQISLSGKLKLKDIIDPFQTESDVYHSDRIQIPALTVDDQIYSYPPTVLLSTVDKFARPAFEPRFATLFGNFDYYHPIYGYNRERLLEGSGRNYPYLSVGKKHLYVKVERADPPDLILQDELHLLEGPIGGMVGIYETAVDYLIRETDGIKPKYIASTATIRNAEDQVKAIFARNVHMFPPFGNNSDDRFFIRDSGTQNHALNDSHSGRLYLGIVAPGRGPLTPITRIWARLLQTGWENRKNPEVNRFWTVTGYFNSVRELAGAVALYRQDIPQRLHTIGGGDPRKITEERRVELSSRINSMELPTILEMLNRDYEPEKIETVDTLFTTSMFGTGIDVSRLGLMIVNGQPKTTSSYIQSTGRIGRKNGGLVVTFLRTTRPRDLSHYEYFTGFHRQLHRFVEPVSAYPFAPNILERALGPVAVLILRNTRSDNISWLLDHTAGKMPEFRRSSTMVKNLENIFESRAQNQPGIKTPPPETTGNKVKEKIDTWEQQNKRSAANSRGVKYAEYSKAENDVVLGDSIHKNSREFTTIYDDAPQSLRDVEETTSFQT